MANRNNLAFWTNFLNKKSYFLSNSSANTCVNFIKNNPVCSSQEILNGLSLKIGTTTIKRYLQDLIQDELVIPTGKNKARRYSISLSYDILRRIDIDDYFSKEIDERVIQNTYNQHLIKESLHKVALFTYQELEILNSQLQLFKSSFVIWRGV